MIRIIRALLLAVVVLCSTSCFRTSTVVKIKEDGSGEITARYYFSPQVVEMVDQMEAFGDNINLDEQMPSFELIREIISPNRESLSADAKSYGEGVSYGKHEEGKDSEGWRGYTVVYRFEDVRKIRIDQNTVPGKAKELVEASGQDLDLEKGGKLTFGLEGKKLTVKSSLASASVDEMIDEEQIAQAKEMGVKPSEAMQAAAASTQGMRAGIFLRIDPGIAETDAEHVTGNLIIMTDAEISKVMQDPDFVSFLDKVVEDPDSVTDDSIRELFGKIEGMTIELSDEITVKFP